MPARNTVAFFQAAPLAMYATKAAKMVNPMREYMPAHAMSMANMSGKASGFWRIMTGIPYWFSRLTDSPMALRKLYAASELMVDRVAPAA